MKSISKNRNLLFYMKTNTYLTLFIDRSILEVFANDRQCLTVRVYPSREDSNGVSVYSKGSEAELVSMRAWQMRSIWPELKMKEGK